MSSTNGLTFRALGPLSAARDDRPLKLGGPRQRLVLALLLLEAGRHVRADRLVDRVWGDDAPASGTGPLRTYIWQLRRALEPPAPRRDRPGDEPAVLTSWDAGYVLHVRPDQVDITRFETAFADGRTAAASGQAEQALTHLETALGLWRGPAFGDLADAPALTGAATRLDQLHLATRELHAEMLLATGQHHQVAAETAALARAHPEREGLWALLMTALYRSGRQHEALRCYQEARDRLIEDVGLEPGPTLRDLEQAILTQDPGLDWRPAEPVTLTPDVAPDPEPGAPPAPDASGGGQEATQGSAPPTNLPRQLTSFVGRDDDLQAVMEAVGSSRLVTLAGSGGCGKTRLALAAAERLAHHAPAGIWFVDLTPVTQADLVPRALAQPLGVEGDPSGQLDHVCRAIGDQRMLLVVDNCEHQVDTVAKTVDELLTRCPELRVLGTSREELGTSPELVWRVPALRLPPAEAGTDVVLASEAVQLFIERGRSSLAGFSPDDEALDAVVQICQQLDGIPLAIELAAALVGSLPLTDIASRLDRQLGLLTDGKRRGPERHRTLRATLDWSYDRLDPGARELFDALSVFTGDFTLAAAEAVAPHATDPLATARGLGHLVRTSMISCVTGASGAQRYRMLETIRQYTAENLAARPDADDYRLRHARYYADLAVEAEQHVHGPAASEWLGRMSADLPNLRAALAWAFAHDHLDTGVRLAGSLTWWVPRMALLDEAAGWLDAGLENHNRLAPDLRLLGLIAAATVAFSQGEFDKADSFGRDGIALARELGDTRQLSIALIVHGAGLVYEGELDQAERCFDEALVLCDRRGDRWGRAWMLSTWATGSRRAGDLARSRAQLEESIRIFRDLGDEHGQVVPLINLGYLAQEEGDVGSATVHAGEAHRLATALGDRQLRHISLCLRGCLALAGGDVPGGRDQLVQCLRDFPGAQNQVSVVIALETLAQLAALDDRYRDATALWGFTHKLRTRSSISASGGRSRELDKLLDQARRCLGADAIESELARGRAMDLHEAVDLAVASTGPAATTL